MPNADKSIEHLINRGFLLVAAFYLILILLPFSFIGLRASGFFIFLFLLFTEVLILILLRTTVGRLRVVQSFTAEQNSKYLLLERLTIFIGLVLIVSSTLHLLVLLYGFIFEYNHHDFHAYIFNITFTIVAIYLGIKLIGLK